MLFQKKPTNQQKIEIHGLKIYAHAAMYFVKSFSHRERGTETCHLQKAPFLTIPPPENEMLAKQVFRVERRR